MDIKLVLLAFFVLAVVFVKADFYFNGVPPKADESKTKLNCLPGRTIIKIKEIVASVKENADSDEEDNNSRRSHMNFEPEKDESCMICVCAASGKAEYCVKRPAMNVNECLRMASVVKEFNKNIPYDNSRVLAYRIRRDYLWHKDEIPYEPKARCKRGASYYSNSITANETDIDVASDIESLLDYSNKDICYYCVCSMDGRGVGCISRDPWFCDYFRNIREEDAARDRYRQLFQQDRPSYFRQLSYRLRRIMDQGSYDFIESGGDTLCCEHPSGHRRNIHNAVRKKIMQLRRRVPKENLMSGGPGGDYVDFIVNNDKFGTSDVDTGAACIPFVSQFTDCTDENKCAGCNECTCTALGQWNCQTVTQCFGTDPERFDEMSINDAWENVEAIIKKNEIEQASRTRTPLVPRPINKRKEVLLEDLGHYGEDKEDVEDFLNKDILGMARYKRSIHESGNDTDPTVQFYGTVDDLNEDTLKNNYSSGTIEMKKHDAKLPAQLTRRTGVFDNSNISSPLHIEYKSKLYDHHITDNKIDTAGHVDDKYNMLDHENIKKIIGNQTQKDKDLSKLIVTELKKGMEVVGDANAPAISNITFTPENDTLTAMAFIAGNLLNKLWNMEKDEKDDSIETDVLKHEKIADLLELFKEPLTLRQETFLKNALEHLFEALDKSKDVSNISLCENVEKVKEKLNITNTTTENSDPLPEACDRQAKKIERTDKENESAVTAIEKINNVLALMKKYDAIKKNLRNLKRKPSLKTGNGVKHPVSKSSGKSLDKLLTDDESESLNLYGNLLEKITKLLVPSKKGKKVVKAIRNQNVFRNSEDLKEKLKRVYDIDLENSTLTAKDKVILDYLANIRNPNCQMNQESPPNAEGGMLLNLSEFFKVKSLVELLQLLQPETEKNMRSSETSTELARIKTTASTTVPTTTVSEVDKNNTDKLTKTKEKLKSHLKAIINDLLELQNVSGISIKEKDNIKITDALPCIYNILNADKAIETKTNKYNISPLSKIKSVFYALMKELKSPLQTRRANLNTGPRPKSAVIWERLVKNLNKEQNLSSRRNLKMRFKTFEEISALMEILESSSNTYKHQALTKDIPHAKRLILLKALASEVDQYINVLASIKTHLDNMELIPAEKMKDIYEFMVNAGSNIKLNENILKNLNKAKNKQITVQSPRFNAEDKNKKLSKIISDTDVLPKPQVKFSRDEIINQLIKNRVQYYIRMKEIEGVDVENDMNIKIAKKILSFLESKNNNLARELFKIFVSQKQPTRFEVFPSREKLSTTTTKRTVMMEPLIQFDTPKSQKNQKSLTQDLLKQLMNIKNMKI